jgi:magnesium and cobalt transporter
VLLREFRLSRNHMAIVIDEYGGVAGLVTIEDVLEQIVGDIDDEHDEAEDDSPRRSRRRTDGQFVVDALTPIDDFNERFGADFDDDEYDTIGGLVTAAIGHLPRSGEELTMGRFVFRVARADARRVHAFHVGVCSCVASPGTPHMPCAASHCGCRSARHLRRMRHLRAWGWSRWRQAASTGRVSATTRS